MERIEIIIQRKYSDTAILLHAMGLYHLYSLVYWTILVLFFMRVFATHPFVTMRLRLNEMIVKHKSEK